MGRPRQALKCSGHRTDGEKCQAYAINGGKVCAAHGGRAPQMKATAALNVAERKAEGLLAGITDFEPVTDPLTELQRVAGRAVRLVEVLEPVVAELKRIRYESQAEQVDGRMVVYERALDRAGKILADMARLNIEERLARVGEAQARQINHVIRGVAAEIGLAVTEEAVRQAVARHIRMVATGERRPAPLALEAQR